MPLLPDIWDVDEPGRNASLVVMKHPIEQGVADIFSRAAGFHAWDAEGFYCPDHLVYWQGGS